MQNMQPVFFPFELKEYSLQQTGVMWSLMIKTSHETRAHTNFKKQRSSVRERLITAWACFTGSQPDRAE